jgi:predicted nucleic acid-binding protein
MKYIDTSAFVKYYADESLEKGASEIQIIIEDAKNGKEKLTSSILLVGETVSVFDRWLRLNLINKLERDKLVSQFFDDLNELLDTGGLILDPLSSLSVTNSIDLILAHHVAINDALHLHSLLSRRSSITTFICSDEHLLKAAEAENVITWNPEKTT